jgi:hypothetical protein
MPYEVKPVGKGYKVFKKGTTKSFSNKALTKTRAIAQMRAIAISEARQRKKK